MPSTTAQELPLEVWFQILNQALNLLLPIATTPRLYATYILPLLLTSHTFHEHCHTVTYPHLRKNKLLQLFTRWKAAHSREVHFYHHPLRNRVRYALPDRVGNPPGEEYETLYGFIKRSYLFGCESVCGTVIPVEGGLEAPVLVPSVPAAAAAAAAAAAGEPALGQGGNQENINAGGVGGAAANAAAATNNSTPASITGTGANNAGNVVVAPPPAQATAPVVTHHGGDGGGQGWKSHALQWHVANPTFAAEGTIELYKDVVEEYRRVICGSAAVRERNREIERAMDMVKNPHRYATELSSSESLQQQQYHNRSQPTASSSEQIRELEEAEDTMEEVKDVEELEDEEEEDEEDEVADDEDEEELIEQDENELLSEIEAKGGLRRRDSGHGQSSSEMDIDDVEDEDKECEGYPRAKRRGSEDEEMMSMDHPLQEQDRAMTDIEPGRSRATKRDPETMAMDYQLESGSRNRRGQRIRKMDRSSSSSESEQEKLILDMSLDKQPSQPMASLSPFHRPESRILPPSPSLPSSSSLGMNPMRSGSPAQFTPLMTSSTRKTRENSAYGRSSRPSRTSLQRSNSSPGTVSSARIPSSRSRLGHSRSFDSSSSSNSSAPVPTPTQQLSTESSPSSSSSPSPSPSLSEPSSSSTISTAPASSQLQPQTRLEELDFDLASACANTFASDLAYVLARVPGLGAHFHRFEQLAKLKLHVGWAKHAQSRGGNDVFVMSCSRLISLLAPLANTPLVSERGG